MYRLVVQLEILNVNTYMYIYMNTETDDSSFELRFFPSRLFSIKMDEDIAWVKALENQQETVHLLRLLRPAGCSLQRPSQQRYAWAASFGTPV